MGDRLGVLQDVAKWPAPLRMAVDGIASVFAFAMQLALERRANLGGAPAEDAEKRALRNENQTLHTLVALLQNRLKAMPPKNRPHFRPQDRLTILRLIWSGMWSVKDASSRLVLSRSTINRWLRIFHGKDDAAKVGLFFGKPPWNKLADAVHDLIRDCRMEFPEPEIGVRTIVAQIVRAGVAVSRSTARRVLKSPPRKASPASATATTDDDASSVPAHHILKPAAINRTWHTDLTTFRVFWFKIHVLAILDGFSRRLLALTVSLKTPTTADVLAAFKTAVVEFGTPRFVVSDRGPQFKQQFDDGLAALSKQFSDPSKPIIHARCKVKNPRFNGKCERFFRSFKLWQRVTLFFAAIFDIKRKVEFFRGWYNAARVHQGVEGRTPDEVWNGTPRREATRYLATDKMQPVFGVARKHHGDDPHLPVFKIKLAQFVKRTA